VTVSEAAARLVRRWTILERVMFVGLATGIVLALGLATWTVVTQEEIRDSQHAQRAVQARQDCARDIANEQTVVKDRLTIAKARLDQAFVAGLLQTAADPASRAEVAAHLDELQRALDAAIREVEVLPPSQELVDRRCPSV
jgi:hypothetical protein